MGQAIHGDGGYRNLWAPDCHYANGVFWVCRDSIQVFSMVPDFRDFIAILLCLHLRLAKGKNSPPRVKV